MPFWYSFGNKLAWGNSPKTSPESGALRGGKLASDMRRGSGQQCLDKSLVALRALLFKSQLFDGYILVYA